MTEIVSIEGEYVTLCAIWYHLYNLKNIKNTHGRLLLLVKLHVDSAILLKVALLHGCFLRFLNGVNGAKSCKAFEIYAFQSIQFHFRLKPTRSEIFNRSMRRFSSLQLSFTSTKIFLIILSHTLRKKSPYSQLFWSGFFPDFPAFGLNTPYLSVFSPNAGKSGENADQNNSEYGLFLRRDSNIYNESRHIAFLNG